MGTSHRQVFVKVNAPVDEGIAEVVGLLSQVPGLETIESCQGDPKRAFVLFRLGGWNELARFLAHITPDLIDPCESVSVSAEAFNGSVPMGRIAFRPEAVSIVERALRRTVRTYLP